MITAEQLGEKDRATLLRLLDSLDEAAGKLTAAQPTPATSLSMGAS